MVERVRMFGIFAAPDMTAAQADAKLIPSGPKGDAFLAATGSRHDWANLAEVLTTLAHEWPISL